MPLTLQQEQKVDQARMVIEEALTTTPIDKIVIAWSGGKDSTLLLWLVAEYCRNHNATIPTVLDIDQADAFPEIIDFRTRLVADWRLDLVVVRNSDFLDRVRNFGDLVQTGNLDAANRQGLAALGHTDATIAWHPASAVCNFLMKAIPVNQYLRDHGTQILLTGIRWDEHPSRRGETYFSPRPEPRHTRVHPLLHFTERDIWDVTFAYGIPHNTLYARGYRSIDTRSGTRKSSDSPAWQQDLESNAEREGRDPEKEKMMEQLRALGYM
jgi:phosphoadenosine phosphosulfate reductase